MIRDRLLRRLDDYYRCTNSYRYDAGTLWLLRHWRAHRRGVGGPWRRIA